MEVLLLIDREFTCRPRSGLLTDKYQVPSNSTVYTSIHLFVSTKEKKWLNLCIAECAFQQRHILFIQMCTLHKLPFLCIDFFLFFTCLCSLLNWIIISDIHCNAVNKVFCIVFQLVVFKVMPSEIKTFKRIVKCRLNDADKFTKVWKWFCVSVSVIIIIIIVISIVDLMYWMVLAVTSIYLQTEISFFDYSHRKFALLDHQKLHVFNSLIRWVINYVLGNLECQLV